MRDLVIGRGRSHSAPAGLGAAAPLLQPDQEEQAAQHPVPAVAATAVEEEGPRIAEQGPEEAAAAVPEERQPEAAKRRRGLRRLAVAGATLKKINGKIKQILGTTSKADKAKKILDTPDTVALRIDAPAAGGVRAHGQATSDTDLLQDYAVIAQVNAASNTVTDLFGLFNDLRTLMAARKGRKASGPESHKSRKDWKGKPVGAAQYASMVVGDVGGKANAAVRNAGQLGGVPALGDVSGGAMVVYSTMIAIRDARVVWKTYTKNRALKKLVREPSGEAPGNKVQLTNVLDRLGEVQQQLARAAAPREPAGSQAESAPADEVAAAADTRRQVLELNHLLEAELDRVVRYARHKQHTKMGKRIASLGGNTVRTTAGSLVIAAVTGAITGPAAPAVAGVAAAVLLGNALYKGARAGSNRYVAVRDPDRWARPTPAQEESGAERPEPKPGSAPAGQRDALKEFFKVAKSVEQGERHFMAQKLYALAAGPKVPVGKNVPDHIRESARALLVVLKAGPSQHKQSKEDWAESLNNPELQTVWEKEITNQLSSA